MRWASPITPVTLGLVPRVQGAASAAPAIIHAHAAEPSVLGMRPRMTGEAREATSLERPNA